MPASDEGVWLRTDEIGEFIDSLEFAAKLSGEVSVNVTMWKWLILALHNALQGSLVCALGGSDTSGCSVLEKPKEMWNWLDVERRKENPGPPPEMRLAKTLELYKRCKRKNYLPAPLKQDLRMDRSIERLNSFRNEFIHFVPQGLSLEVSGMPRIVRDCCSAIEHLAIKHPTFDHHMKSSDRSRIVEAIERLRFAMIAWEQKT